MHLEKSVLVMWASGICFSPPRLVNQNWGSGSDLHCRNSHKFMTYFLQGNVSQQRTYPISDLSSFLNDRCLYGAALGVPRQLSEVDFARRTAVSVMTEFQRLAGDTLRVQGWPCLQRLPQGSQRQVRGLHHQRDPASNQVILSRYFSEHPLSSILQ